MAACSDRLLKPGTLLSETKEVFDQRSVISLGAKIIAFVLAVVEVGKENEIAQQLREAGVAESEVVYGEYDLLCKIETDTIEQLDSAMTRLRKTPGLIRTVTLLGSKRE